MTNWSDKNEALEAVGRNGWFLKYASDAIKNDREIVMAAVIQSSWGLCYASSELRCDHELIDMVIVTSQRKRADI